MAKKDRVSPDTQGAGAAGVITLVPARTKCAVSGILGKSRCCRVDGSMDEQLCQLMREVLRHGDGSEAQRQTFDPLLRLIPTLPGIYRYRQDPNFDYPDALNRALEGVSVYRGNVSGQNIRRFLKNFELDLDNHEPAVVQQGFVKWFNGILRNKIAGIYREIYGKRKKGDDWSLDFSIDGGTPLVETLPAPNLDEIYDLIKQEEKQEQEKIQRIGLKLWQYIEEDPEQILRKCHPREHPEANCQELTKRLQLKDPPDKLAEIARELNVNYQTLNSHWKRSCLPLLRDIAMKFGYQQESES